MEQNVIKLNFDGTLYNVRPYCVCTATANNSFKTINIEGFSEVLGATVLVKFTNGNTVGSPTFAVSNGVNSPAYSTIKYQGRPLTDPKLYTWAANSIIEFFYDGTSWNLISISPTYDLSSYATTTYVNNEVNKVSSSLTNYQPLIDEISSSSTAVTISGMVPNTLYRYTNPLTSLTINSVNSVDGGYNEYMLEFTPANNFSFKWNAGKISWINGTTPAWTAGAKFHVSVVNNLAISGKF